MSEKKVSTCRGCGAVIKWGQKELPDGSLKSHPYDPDTGDSHFKTCTKRDQFKGKPMPTLRQVSEAVRILKARGAAVEDLYGQAVDKIIAQSKEEEAESEWS